MKFKRIPDMGKFLMMILLFCGLFFSCQKEEEPDLPEEEEEEEIEPTPFSVMSFNIRHHNDNDPQYLFFRKEHILKIITENTPDIVGLQEFSDNWFETWMEDQMSSLGYDHYIDAAAGRGSPKAIFYKNDRFTKKAEDTFQMNYSEGRTGTWVILYDQLNRQDYFISNSHWTTVSSADRVKSANKVVSEIHQNYRELPIIIFGDFNARPGTPEITILEESDLNLIDADENNMNTFHGWDAVGNSKLDYIFYSPEFEKLKHEVIRTSYNNYWPSDHWPIMTSFNWKTGDSHEES